MAYLYSRGERVFGDITFEDDTNTQIDFDDDYIGLVAGGTTILAVSASSVGIGTTTPDTLLHLYGTSPAITLQRNNNSTGTSTINFEGVAGVVACKMGQVAGTDNELAFSTHDGSNLLERMRIDEDGLIGIGTNAPEAYLDIKNTTDDGTTNRTMIRLHNYRADDANVNDWAPTSIDFEIENVAGGVKGATARIATVLAPAGTDHNSTEGEQSSALIFSTMDDETLSEAMRINHKGNIGIGTNEPEANLDISSSTTKEPVCSLTNTNADHKPPSIQFYKDSESSADDDGLGSIEFYGRNAAGAKTKFASIDAYSSDVSVDDEAGEIVFSAMIGGRLGNSSLTECMVFGMEDTGAGQRGFALQINRQEATDIDFIVRGNTIANLFRTRCEADQVSIGSGADANINAIFQVIGTTYASQPAPRMTSTQRDALSNLAGGCMIYNITTNKLQCYNGTSWQDCF